MHSGNMLCYARSVYMPLSFLYGKRFVGQITGLVPSLREELYSEPYYAINWNIARTTCAKVIWISTCIVLIRIQLRINFDVLILFIGRIFIIHIL